MVEEIAEEIRRVFMGHAGTTIAKGKGPRSWGDLPEVAKTKWRDMARAAIEVMKSEDSQISG